MNCSHPTKRSPKHTPSTPLRLFSFLLLFVLIFVTSKAPEAQAENAIVAHTFTGTVMTILEADLIRVLHKGKFVTVRLSDIATPKPGQPYAKEAKQFTAMMIFSGPVRVKVKNVDLKLTAIAEVSMMDSGLNLNRELVKAGLAWWDWKKTDDNTYGELEQRARDMKIGLWKDEKRVAPWEFEGTSP